MIRRLTVYLEENEDEWERGQNDWLESKKISEWEIMSEEEKRKEVTKSTREENNTTPEMTPLSALRSTCGQPNTPLQNYNMKTNLHISSWTLPPPMVTKLGRFTRNLQLYSWTPPHKKILREKRIIPPQR